MPESSELDGEEQWSILGPFTLSTGASLVAEAERASGASEVWMGKGWEHEEVLPKWQHQCSLKHFPWLWVAQMESPSQGRKSGLPAQLLAKACASSNFSLFGLFPAREAAMPTFPVSPS
ncbi:hypothetical protein EYF80_005165 [Liparis tanakae]|uniref:Uncharacterized protein n=1 Tax=Liparis tanakae TaxID=230148 RepID=A0A4Z2J283_9TELE|nr:hypothetical protein EYF80_005165 [Liparis tanakae]